LQAQFFTREQFRLERVPLLVLCVDPGGGGHDALFAGAKCDAPRAVRGVVVGELVLHDGLGVGLAVDIRVLDEASLQRTDVAVFGKHRIARERVDELLALVLAELGVIVQRGVWVVDEIVYNPAYLLADGLVQLFREFLGIGHMVGGFFLECRAHVVHEFAVDRLFIDIPRLQHFIERLEIEPFKAAAERRPIGKLAVERLLAPGKLRQKLAHGFGCIHDVSFRLHAVGAALYGVRNDRGVEAMRHFGDDGALFLVEELHEALHLVLDVFIEVVALDLGGRRIEVAVDRAFDGVLHPCAEVAE